MSDDVSHLRHRSQSGLLRRASSSLVPQRATPTRLLAGVTVAGFGEFGVNACIVEASGKRQHFENVRLIDLVRQAWPGTDHPGTLCRRLRFLVDSTKHDFVMRSSRDAIFVRSDIARAMIEPSRVLFVDIHNPTFGDFLEELLSEMADGTYLQERTFNSWIVECILCANVTLQSLRLNVMKPVATHILDNIRLDKSEDSILQLYPVKKALSTLIEQMRPLVNCLVHGGDVEKEAAHVHHTHGQAHVHHTHGHRSVPERLPRAAMNPQVKLAPAPAPDDNSDADDRDSAGSETASQVPARRKVSDAGSWTSRAILPAPGIEEVLDGWALTAEELMADAAELNNNIEDAIRFLEASMSCMRNRLLTLELGAEVAALCMTMGALVSGIFGMNLKSGVEEEPGWFDSVIAFIVIASASIMGVAIWIVYRSRSHYSNHSARFGNNKFFRSFGDDSYILALGSDMTGGTLPTTALDRALQDLTKPALPVGREASMQHPNFSTMSTPRRSGPASFQPRGSRSNLSTELMAPSDRHSPRDGERGMPQQPSHPGGPDSRTLLAAADAN